MKSKHTPGPWYPVNYAGYWHIQSSDYYEKSDLLDEEVYKNAEENAKLAARAPELLRELEETLKDMKVIIEGFTKELEIREGELRTYRSLVDDAAKELEGKDKEIDKIKLELESLKVVLKGSLRAVREEYEETETLKEEIERLKEIINHLRDDTWNDILNAQ